MLLLNTNKKSYTSMETADVSLDLTLSYREMLNSMSFRLWRRICFKEAELGHMLQLNINRTACMWSLAAPLDCLFGWPWSQGHADFEGLFLAKEPSWTILDLPPWGVCFKNNKCVFRVSLSSLGETQGLRGCVERVYAIPRKFKSKIWQKARACSWPFAGCITIVVAR